MRKALLIILFSVLTAVCFAQVRITHYIAPVVQTQENLLLYTAAPDGVLTEFTVKFEGLNRSVVESVYISDDSGILSANMLPDMNGYARFRTTKVPKGWVRLGMMLKRDCTLPLAKSFSARVTGMSVDGKAVAVEDEAPLHHFGLVIRSHGYDGVDSYRIPGLVTSTRGTLVACFDIRHNSSYDLQEDIDVGVMRSTDGGLTWGPMITAMDMGLYGGLGQNLNGIGDPCILVDEETGDILLFAAWVHGTPGAAWFSAKDGFDIGRTPQLMMARSTDDGLTWSEPVNLTRQIKQEEWNFTFQGPGRGITMADGTLVVPFQHQEADRTPAAGIMYSKDRGATWTVHNYAKINTTESQVAEIEPGKLLLAIRDNRGGSRAMYLTSDLGRSWKPYASDGLLPDPVCMGSIIHVYAIENSLSRDLVLFSNPADAKERKNITIRASFDGGETFPTSVLLDQGYSWGYSCMSMIDRSTVGILYESSVGHMTFQAVSLDEFR